MALLSPWLLSLKLVLLVFCNTSSSIQLSCYYQLTRRKQNKLIVTNVGGWKLSACCLAGWLNSRRPKHWNQRFTAKVVLRFHWFTEVIKRFKGRCQFKTTSFLSTFSSLIFHDTPGSFSKFITIYLREVFNNFSLDNSLPNQILAQGTVFCEPKLFRPVLSNWWSS